jgi:UDP-glucose 4-epimerase
VGPRASHRVILDFIRKLKKVDTLLEVLGDGTQEKPYLYVYDLLDAILCAWEGCTLEPYEVFNIGSKSATKVQTIAESVVEAMGLESVATIQYGSEPRGRPGDVPKFTHDLTKIHKLGSLSPSQQHCGGKTMLVTPTRS